MKNIFRILIVLCITLITGCSSNTIKEINYKEFYTLIKNKQTFILYIGSTSCHNCVEFSPKLKVVIKENNIKNVKYIDLDKLSEKEKNGLNKIINVSGTPTVVFVTNGEEKSMTNRINGNVSKEKIISRLKSNEYIK